MSFELLMTGQDGHGPVYCGRFPSRWAAIEASVELRSIGYRHSLIIEDESEDCDD